MKANKLTLSKKSVSSLSNITINSSAKDSTTPSSITTWLGF